MSTRFPDALPVSTALRGGDYVLEATLGQGGFGITYRARDEVLHRAAAIKEFFPRCATRDSAGKAVPAPSTDFQKAKEQFLSEARALARFNHPHIADVYSVFEENATAYMVMEFVRGPTLTQLVEARDALPASEALPIIEQIGAALTAVHNAGLLHLDVKPDNVIVEDESARAVLLDFGLTKKIETASGYGTTRLDEGARFGTPGFAAIEQYSDRNRTGVFTDVYSLAAVLYFLLTGAAPPDALARATGTPLPDARSLSAGVSTPVAEALGHALRLPPDERPPSVAAFLQALHQEAATQIQVVPAGTRLPSPEPASGAFDYNDPFGARDPNRPGPWRRTRRRSFDPAPNAGPFAFLPVGFGCTSLACAAGCFLFILVFLLVIASMISSVSAVFPF